jgi:hypothetical protein
MPADIHLAGEGEGETHAAGRPERGGRERSRPPPLNIAPAARHIERTER